MVGGRRHNVGLTARESLIDIVVHGQDIAIPLGLTLEVPPQVAAEAASRVMSYQATPVSRLKARVFRQVPTDGFHLAATDVSWSVGDGPEVRGPVLAILLVLTGRPAGLAYLDGEGAADLASRFARFKRAAAG